MRIRRLMAFLLAITVCMAFSNTGTALAGSGVYPDSPRQLAPLDYGDDKDSIEFTFYSYDYNDGSYVGYPVAYYIKLYKGSTYITSEVAWSTSITFSPFISGETYSWQVQAIYEFYDEFGEYCGLYESEWSSLATFRNITAAKPAVPLLVFPKFDLQNGADFAGGKNCTLAWFPSLTTVDDLEYSVDVAKDSNFSTIIDTITPVLFMASFNKLPADGSQLFWRVKARNEFGWSDYSATESFFNDCYMASIGSGGALA